MKKLIVAIILVFLIIGSVGVLYATGNFERIVDKILHRSEVLDMSDEENFDEILRRVKENLDGVESVRAEVKGGSWAEIGDYDPFEEEGEGSIEFIFPDKKSISTENLPPSLR